MARRAAMIPGRAKAVEREPRAVQVRQHRWWVGTFAVVAVVGVGIGFRLLSAPSVNQVRSRAEGESRAEEWNAALADWRTVNRSDQANARSLLGEARACLALGLAGQAERALRRACEADPSDGESWLLRLELLRLEDRPLEAQSVGWAAFEAVPRKAHREVLQALTLALLADTPDDLARQTLERWVAADRGDVDAKVALLRRMATDPRPSDPDRAARIAQLAVLLAREPANLDVREALILALADAGETTRGRLLLDEWPAAARDARFDRLRGQWSLNYERRPERAIEAFRKAQEGLPHDWKSHYGLSRALQALGRVDEANKEAEAVKMLRETLDPKTLGPRLDADLAHVEDPAAAKDLAELCDRVGLARLAHAWRVLASQPRSPGAARGGSTQPMLPSGR
jgi:Flp pilus assembly protein TadD